MYNGNFMTKLRQSNAGHHPGAANNLISGVNSPQYDVNNLMN